MDEITENLWMCGGTPRPIRAQKAPVTLFPDRPRKEDSRLKCKFVDYKSRGGALAKEKLALAVQHICELRELKEVPSKFECTQYS